MNDDLYVRLLYDMKPADVYKMLDAFEKELPVVDRPVGVRDLKRAVRAAMKTLPSIP